MALKIIIYGVLISTSLAVSSPDYGSKSLTSSSSSGTVSSSPSLPPITQTSSSSVSTQTRSTSDKLLNSISSGSEHGGSSQQSNVNLKQYTHSSYPPSGTKLKPQTYSNSIYSQSYGQSGSIKSVPNLQPQNSHAHIETDFQPIHSHAASKPVIMQVVHHQVQHNGENVQYLQFIPTRPLIIPISPYIPQVNQQPQYQSQPHYPTYDQSSQSVVSNEQNSLSSNSLPYTLSTNRVNGVNGVNGALAIGYPKPYSDYRGYRQNRETGDNNVAENNPLKLKLNLNEYIPGPNEKPSKRAFRGRP